MSRPFAACLFESEAIKAWSDVQAPPLRRALISTVEALRGKGSLLLDLLVDVEATALEPVVEASSVALWRSRPSTSLGARVRRSLGFYSGESRLAAAVQVASGAEVDRLLPDSALWDAEFALYPEPPVPLTKLPDPHFEVTGFAAKARWMVNQDATHESWLITGYDVTEVERVSKIIAQCFQAEGLNAEISAAPESVYGE